jgi:hypothetical protein
MVEAHPEKRPHRYARVSTYWQTRDSQLKQLRGAGCGSRKIFREKGARRDQRSLTACLASWPQRCSDGDED